MTKDKTNIKYIDCDYCGSNKVGKNVGTPFMADIGKSMCRKCWKATTDISFPEELEPKDKTNIEEIKLRLLLNDFFQDIDTEATVGADLANAIVDVHLKKFTRFLEEELKDQRQAECEKPILKHIDERLKQHRDNLELWNNGTLTPTAEDEQDIELTKEGLKACIYELSELKDFIQKGAKGA